MDRAWPMIQLLLPALVAAAWGAQPRTPWAGTDLLNICVDAKHHKTKPGPEDKLHGQVRREWSHGLEREVTLEMEESREVEDQLWGAMESGGWPKGSSGNTKSIA